MITSDDGEIRSAAVSDAPEIRDVIRSGFSDEFLSMTPYGSASIEQYIRDLIARQDAGVDTRYVVATRRGRLSGCVELRLQPATIIINYICVLPEHQTRGIGKRLLTAALRQCALPQQRTVALDVLASNARAHAWYERLGFVATSQTHWWTARSNGDANDEPVLISGYPQAEAVHERYGFSQFSLQTTKGAFSVGRLNKRWFRITDPTLAGDRGAISALARLEPSRNLLVLISGSEAPIPSDCQPVSAVVTVRLQNSMDDVMQRLEQGRESVDA